MPLFKAYSRSAEVSGRIILPVAEGMPQYAEVIRKILHDSGNLADISAEQWYNQQNFLDGLKAVLEKLGPNTLFSLGKLVTASYPHQFNDLKAALLAVDEIYQRNHRNGDPGYCKLTDFNPEKKAAYMECKVPYPADFQRGVLLSIIRKYKGSFGLVTVKSLDHPESDSDMNDLQLFEFSW